MTQRFDFARHLASNEKGNKRLSVTLVLTSFESMGIVKRLALVQPRTLFLIDGLGAMLTAGLLLGQLSNFEGFFGVPRQQLYILAAIAGIFALYSMTCYVVSPASWKLFLKMIALANLAYCVFTLVMVFFFSGDVTAWGMAYFVGEAMIVGGLVFLELRMAFRPRSA